MVFVRFFSSVSALGNLIIAGVVFWVALSPIMQGLQKQLILALLAVMLAKGGLMLSRYASSPE